MKVLIVEDDPVIRESLTDLMQHWGYVSEGCGDGLVAWDMLRAEPFDLLILDLNSPGWMGCSLISAI